MTQTSKGFIVRAYHFIYKSLVCYSLFEISIDPHTVPALSQGPEPQSACWVGGFGGGVQSLVIRFWESLHANRWPPEQRVAALSVYI